MMEADMEMPLSPSPPSRTVSTPASEPAPALAYGYPSSDEECALVSTRRQRRSRTGQTSQGSLSPCRPRRRAGSESSNDGIVLSVQMAAEVGSSVALAFPSSASASSSSRSTSPSTSRSKQSASSSSLRTAAFVQTTMFVAAWVVVFLFLFTQNMNSAIQPSALVSTSSSRSSDGAGMHTAYNSTQGQTHQYLYGYEHGHGIAVADEDDDDNAPDQQSMFNFQSQSQSNGNLSPPPPPSFHFCRTPVVDQLSSTEQQFVMQYQCHGEAYEAFAQRLQAFANDTYYHHFRSVPMQPVHAMQDYSKSQIGSASASPSLPAGHAYGYEPFTWGQAEYPLPPNKTVLVFGNSHLRQISKTIMCQYANIIQSYEMIDADTFTVQFRNGAKWISITNTAVVYSHQWPQLLIHLSSHLQPSLANVDAIVLGKFNTYKETKRTAFGNVIGPKIQLLQQQHGDSIEINFKTIDPPNLTDVAAVYDGPILSVSMFSLQDVYRAQRIRHVMRKLQRPNLRFLNGRKYMLELGECGSDARKTVGTCYEPGDTVPNSDRDPADMHRCTGPSGGHPDLVGWDMVEALGDMIPSQR